LAEDACKFLIRISRKFIPPRHQGYDHMARREIGKLSPAKVRQTTKPGMYGDGGGLWLHVGPSGSKSWVFRYMLAGKAREMGLGPIVTVGLALARERAAAARLLRHDGSDPLEARKAEKAAKAAVAAAAVTFRAAASGYIKAHRPAWRNQKHAWQWDQTLSAHVYPVVGELSVAAIDTGHVTRILEPIWVSKAETAARVRGRIEAILDYAKTHGWRTGENPARWKGHLQNVLPARGKVARVEHRAALPWSEAGAFMAELGKQTGTAALALRFAILTAGRTGEVLGARWGEIDLQSTVWTVPGDRMKAGKEHRVPLAGDAVALLREVAKLRQSDAADAVVFPGGKAAKGVKPLSNMAMLVLLRRMGRGDLTVHGFRSTFRDWTAGTTNSPREVVEAALAHTIESKAEAAYRRGDLFAKRRRLMTERATFCGRPAPAVTGNVAVLRAAG
jgi:integrase